MSKDSKSEVQPPNHSRVIPPGWELADDGKAIRRTYTQPSFRCALAFVAWIGELAEVADHHPDVDLRYKRVVVTLSTHSAGGLTEKDFAFARQLDHSG